MICFTLETRHLPVCLVQESMTETLLLLMIALSSRHFRIYPPGSSSNACVLYVSGGQKEMVSLLVGMQNIFVFLYCWKAAQRNWSSLKALGWAGMVKAKRCAGQ